MGLFSGLFGGGGGSSSSTSNKTEVTVNPTTNVTVETEEIAEAIFKGAELEAQSDLQAKAMENQTKLQELEQEALQDSKRNYQYLLLLGVGVTYLVLRKKGAK